MNLSDMSREALVDALIESPPRARSSQGSKRKTCVQESGPRELRLKRILGIARELLLRDLRQDALGAEMPGPAAIRDWLRIFCADLEHEVFLVLFLDTHNRLLDTEVMFRGTLTATVVYPREVVKAALARNAAAVVLVHNHPSGNPEPSRSDQHLTVTLKQALALVDVSCLDHFVVAGDHLFSMAERGMM